MHRPAVRSTGRAHGAERPERGGDPPFLGGSGDPGQTAIAARRGQRSGGRRGAPARSQANLDRRQSRPAGETKTKRERLQQLETAVGKAVVKLSYHPQMALLESIFTRDFRDEYLAGEYDALVRQVLRMANDGTDSLICCCERSFGASRSPADLRRRRTPIPAFCLGTMACGRFSMLFSDRLDVEQLADDTDFILWDRVCRVPFQRRTSDSF